MSALTCIRFAALALFAAIGMTNVARAAQPDPVQRPQDTREPAAHPPGSLGDRIVTPGAPADADEAGEEALPPIGKGEVLSERQIRYCMAEKARIDAVRTVLNRYDPDEVRRFNERVADFNARCSSYRFYGTAREDASAWLDSVRPRIEQEARDAQERARPVARRSKGKDGGGKPAAVAGAPSPQVPTQKSAEPVEAPAAAAPRDPAPQPPAAKRETKRETTPEAAQAGADVPSSAAVQSPPEVPATRGRPAAPVPAPPRPPVAAATGAAGAAAAADAQGSQAAHEVKESPAHAIPPATSPDFATSTPPAPSPAAPATPTPSSAASPAATPAPVSPVEPAAPAPATTAAADSAQPATGGSPQSALAKLTQEVREVGTMVLPRPKDATTGDLTAQVEVRYAAAGFINSIVIAQSSGSPFLDEEALARARALRLPNAPEELRGKEFSVQFPVVFRSPR